MDDAEDGSLYRSIVEHATDIIATLEPASGRITYISPSVHRALGYTPEELVGTSIGGLAGPDGSAQVIPSLEQRVRRAERGDRSALYANDLVEARRRNGDVVALELASTLVAGDGGRITGVVCIARDVTGRAALAGRAGERPAGAEPAAEQPPRRAVHDLNNLLTAVLGYSTFALTRLPPDHAAAADLKEVRDAAAQAAELVRVHFARVDRP